VAVAAAPAGRAAAIFLRHRMKTEAAGTGGTVVSTGSTSLGRVLVNSRGHTLYLFSKDKNGKSACAGMCATFWPPLIAAGKPRVAGGACTSPAAATQRAGGRLQVSDDSQPPYTFDERKVRGQTNGE